MVHLYYQRFGLKRKKTKKKKHPAVAMLKMYVNVEHWLRFVSVYTVS